MKCTRRKFLTFVSFQLLSRISIKDDMISENDGLISGLRRCFFSLFFVHSFLCSFSLVFDSFACRIILILIWICESFVFDAWLCSFFGSFFSFTCCFQSLQLCVKTFVRFARDHLFSRVGANVNSTNATKKKDQKYCKRRLLLHDIFFRRFVSRRDVSFPLRRIACNPSVNIPANAKQLKRAMNINLTNFVAIKKKKCWAATNQTNSRKQCGVNTGKMTAMKSLKKIETKREKRKKKNLNFWRTA